MLEKASKRIKQKGNHPYASINYQLDILEQLSKFAFGRYLLQNQGINGYWTNYMLTHPWFRQRRKQNHNDTPPNKIESFLLNKAPTVLATQQRFAIFLQESQKIVKNSAALACVPCGMMGELLYLNYENIKKINLIGIDYDQATLSHANELAKSQGLSKHINLVKQNAWNLKLEQQVDLISSNGLNIYEPCDKKVTELYTEFYNNLKPGGKLVTSFLTPPINSDKHCEWDMSNINKEDLLLQKIIFSDVVDAKWQCYRSSAQTQLQLESAGFTKINFIYDQAKIFPTVVAYKSR